MLPEVFEHAAAERPQTHSLDQAATLKGDV